MPTRYDSVQIERAAFEIPVAGRGNLDAVVRQVPIEVGNSFAQGMCGFVEGHGRGNHPEAELFALQSSAAVRDQCVEHIVFRLVEETKMCAPGHVADDVDSASAHLGCHGDDLPIRSYHSARR